MLKGSLGGVGKIVRMIDGVGLVWELALFVEELKGGWELERKRKEQLV